MNRRIVIIALVTSSIIAAFVAIVWYLIPFVVSILGVYSLLGIGVPTVLTAVLFLAFSRRRESRRRALMLLWGAAAFGCFWGLAMFVNHLVYEREVRIAMEYPVRVEPLLEQYRQTHGAYPGNIDHLPSRPPLPRLYRGDGYRKAGDTYEFSFQKPDRLWDSWAYDSDSRSWYSLD